MEGLSLPFGQAVLQYLGSTVIKQGSIKGKDKETKELRRPKIRYDLDQVC
jgi:hypothetical protein